VFDVYISIRSPEITMEILRDDVGELELL
jgi:hypothetical protein